MSFQMRGSLSLYPKFVDGAFTWYENVTADFGLADGTASNQANGYWSATLTINADDDETLDLLGLAFSAFNGTGTVAFSSVKSLVVVNHSAVTKLTLAPGASNGWDEIDGTVSVGKSGVLALHSPVDGLPVTGTSRTFTVTNTNAVTTLTGNTTTGQASIAGLSSTAGLAVGMLASGTGIPAGAKIASITNGTSLVLTANATATATGVSVDFKWPAATVSVYATGILD